MYPPELTAPMAKELNDTGVTSLHSEAEGRAGIGEQDGQCPGCRQFGMRMCGGQCASRRNAGLAT